MPHLSFTPNLERVVACPAGSFAGGSVRAVLEAAFATRPETRAYVLDDRGALRKHVVVFVNGEQVTDREGLADAVGPDDRVFVMQALSGG
ncbi:MAG: MoaD/ThiS family protein [Myxococcota bacterium]